MARERGTFNFSASLEIKKEGALDARQVVQTKAELTLTSTWLDDDNKVWLYKGLLVCVVADIDINNGVYFLIDKDNYNLSTSWVKIGSISGSTPDELLEAINNALETAKAYTDDKAGTVTFTGSNYITNSGDLTEAVVELDDLLKNIRDTYLPLSGGKMTGPIGIPYNGIQTPSGNRLIFYNDNELWFGHENYRGVWETSNTDLLHRKNDTNYTILDTSNFVAGTDYLAPGNVTIADISDLGSTWDSYLKAGVYDRNITVNGTTYPVMTDVSGATAINIYAPTTAGTSGQFLKSTGGTPSWNSITVADISNLNSTWDTFMTGSNLDTRNILINGSAWTVYSSVGTDTTRIYAPTTTGSTGQFLTSAGNGSTTPPTWANINLSDISGLQTDGDGSLYLANDGTYKEVSALSEQEIYTLVPSATANEDNASVYTLVKNNSNVVVVYKDNGLFFPISWKSTTESAVFGSAVIYDFPIDTEGSESDNWISYDVDLNSDGVCLCTQRSLTDSFKSVGVFSFQYSPDNAGAIFNEQIYPIIHGMGGYIAVTDVDESGNTITKHIGKMTKTPDNITIVCTEGNTQITYVCTPDGNMTKQEANITINWSNIGSKPSTFTPSTHTHTVSQITDFPSIWAWASISGKPTFAAVATSGSYNDLTDKPSIPSAYTLPTASSSVLGGIKVGAGLSISGDGILSATGGGVADSVAWENVVGKPDTFTPSTHTHTASQVTGLADVATSGSYNDLTDTPAATTLSSLGVTATATELNYVDGVTGNILTQLNSKAATTHTHPASQITDLAAVATSGSYNDLSDKPSIPSAYTLPIATSDTLGGIRVGGGLTISGAGVLSATGGGVADSVDIENVEGLNSSWLALLQTAPTRYVTADPTWEQVSGKPVFASVATSGSYDDLTDKPTIPSLSGYATQSWVNSQGFLTSVAWDDIQSKPSSFTPSTHTHPVSQVTGIGTITFTGAVSATYNGTQDISVNIPTTGSGVADSVDWSNVTNKPNWIGSSKPTYSFSEISGTITIGDLPTGTTGSTVALGNHTHSNYLTSSSLSGYATQSWVQDQGYLTSVPAQSWSSITGKPSWIGSSKPSYSYSEISGTVPVADLPIATADTVGVVRIGAGLTINSSGVLSATGGGTADAVDLDNITGMNSTWKTLLASAPTRYVTSDPTWSQITGKPSTFTPSSHTHVFSDITFNNTGTNSQYLAGDGKFYTIGWNEISGKPSTFSPSSHTHSAADITSGTLAIARIPTGTTSSTVALGNHTHSNYATTTEVNNLTYTDVGAASASHTHGTDDVTILTGYTEGTSTSTLTSSMTLNAALASLLNQVQTKANSSHTHTISQITNMGTLTFTGAATGSYDGSGNLTINIPEGSSVDTSNFVTLDGTQTITGTKTFTQYTVFNAGAGTSSDKRLKRNIKPIENPFEILEGLTGYRYTLIPNNAKSVGLIAQDVEKVLPEAVRTNDDGYKSVDTYPIVAVLVETIKELKKEIEELKSRL